MRGCIVFLLLMVIFTNCFAGKVVIFLYGSGCAGKTSLCGELKNQSDEFALVSEDEIFYKAALERWKNEFTEEFIALAEAIEPENILHAVMRNQILFRTNASGVIRSKAKTAINFIQEQLNNRPRSGDDPSSWSNKLRNHITQTIIDLAKIHHVVVDTWFLKEEHVKAISQQNTVIHVAVYCPFLELVKRTMQRNCYALMNEHDISNLRFFHQALNGFIGLYDISDVKDGSIDSLTKESVIYGCDRVRMCLEDGPKATGAIKQFTRGEFSLTEFEKYQEDLLAKFNGEIAYIHPKHKMDHIIRTDQGSPAECAKAIISLVNE